MFLEVKFHDNDFSEQMRCALTRLYEYLDIYSFRFSDEGSTRKAFQILHEKNRLAQYFQKFMILEKLSSKVGKLASSPSKQSENCLDVEELCKEFKKYSKYFKITKENFAFHNKPDFANQWQNYEHAWLCLETGESGVF